MIVYYLNIVDYCYINIQLVEIFSDWKCSIAKHRIDYDRDYSDSVNTEDALNFLKKKYPDHDKFINLGTESGLRF